MKKTLQFRKTFPAISSDYYPYLPNNTNTPFEPGYKRGGRPLSHTAGPPAPYLKVLYKISFSTPIYLFFK